MAEVLADFNATNKLKVVDTFSGHPRPNKDEVDVWGNNMLERYELEIKKSGAWAASSKICVEEYLSSIYANLLVRQEEINIQSKFDWVSQVSCLRIRHGLV